jgi:hypothetical protein
MPAPAAMPTEAPIVPARPAGVSTKSPFAWFAVISPPTRLSEPLAMPSRTTF